MLAGRRDEPVGDEDEGAVGEGDAPGAAEMLVEDRPEAELVGEGADDEDGAPVGGLADVEGRGVIGLGLDVAGEEAAELGEDLEEGVLAAEVSDDALSDLAVFAVGLDDADVLVDGAAGGTDFDGPGEHDRLLASGAGRGPATHADHYHDRSIRNQGKFREYVGVRPPNVVTTHSKPREGQPRADSRKTRRFRARHRRPLSISPQTWVSLNTV